MESYGSARLAELLTELTDAIRDAGCGWLLDRLRPGLPAEQVRAGFRQIGLHPPGEVLTWFAWADGSTGYMIPGRYFLPLSDLLETYKQSDKGPRTTAWWPDWVPLATAAPPDIAVQCGPEGTDLAPVKEYDAIDGGFARDSPFTEAQPSLCVPVSWWIEHYRTGIYVWDDQAGDWDWERKRSVPRERRRLA